MHHRDTAAQREKGIRRRLPAYFIGAIFFGALALLCTLTPDTWHLTPSAHAQTGANANVSEDTPTITISGATVNTSQTQTHGAHEAQIQWVFGTVTGTYSTCTVQAQTTLDGTNWLTLGTPAAVTVTSNTLNSWTLVEQLGTSSVTTSAVSSAASLGFGWAARFKFACTSYGTSAPVKISVLYR